MPAWPVTVSTVHSRLPESVTGGNASIRNGWPRLTGSAPVAPAGVKPPLPPVPVSAICGTMRTRLPLTPIGELSAIVCKPASKIDSPEVGASMPVASGYVPLWDHAVNGRLASGSSWLCT